MSAFWKQKMAEWYTEIGRKGDPLRFPNLTQDAFKAGWDAACAQTLTEPLLERIKELEKGDTFLLYKKLHSAEDEIKDLKERAGYWKNEYEKVSDNYAPYLEILYKIAELLPQDIKHGVMLAYKSIEEKEQP